MGGGLSHRDPKKALMVAETSFEPLSVKIELKKMWPVGVMKNGWIDGYVKKKTHAKPRFFTHAQSGNG